MFLSSPWHVTLLFPRPSAHFFFAFPTPFSRFTCDLRDPDRFSKAVRRSLEISSRSVCLSSRQAQGRRAAPACTLIPVFSLSVASCRCRPNLDLRSSSVRSTSGVVPAAPGTNEMPGSSPAVAKTWRAQPLAILHPSTRTDQGAKGAPYHIPQGRVVPPCRSMHLGGRGTTSASCQVHLAPHRWRWRCLSLILQAQKVGRHFGTGSVATTASSRTRSSASSWKSGLS